jgi:thiamine biosynthesis lipoprotein
MLTGAADGSVRPVAAVASTTFSAIGTDITVMSTRPDELTDAECLVRTRLGALDRVASRFRRDSELSRLNKRSADLAKTDPAGRLEATITGLLADCLAAAMAAQHLTDGLVCAALGVELAAAGYDDDIAVVQARRQVAGYDGPLTAGTAAQPGRGRQWSFDSQHGLLTLPAGAHLDLGASAKAWAADSIADDLSGASGGFLVNLGGDIAVAGEPPEAGWAIGVEDWTGELLQVVSSTGQAVATSSTRVRTWLRDGERRHHIIDPATGRSACTRWAQVSCAGPNALRANAAATASIILDAAAPAWLRDRGVPACLVAHDRTIVTTPGWPAP